LDALFVSNEKGKAEKNKIKQNKTKQNKTKQNKTKQNKTKQNKNLKKSGHFENIDRDPLKDSVIRLADILISLLCSFQVRVKGVEIFHNEFLCSHQPEPWSNLISVLSTF